MDNPPTNRPGRSRFVPNTFALVLQTVVATLITLAQVKILSNYLQQETFGLFASLRGFSLLLTIIAANGLPQLLVRYLPEHESKGEREYALRLSAACVAVSFGLLVVLAAAVQLLRPWLLAFTEPALLGRGMLLWFYAMTLGIMLKTVVYGGLNGLRRLGTQMVLETASLLAILLWILVEREHLTLLLLFKIFGTVHLAALGLAVPLFFLSLMRLPRPHPADTGGTGKEAVCYRYRPYLVWAIGLGFVAVAFSDVDRYLLAQLLTLEVLAVFHIGARLGRLANRLLGVAHLAFQPEITRLKAEGRTSGIQPATRIFIKFNSAVAVLIMCVIVLFAQEIIVVVASRDYLAATPLLIILALCLPLNTVTAPLTTVMKAMDQIRSALMTDIAWASTYLTLMVVLAPRFGLVGVGLAQLCACVLQLLVTLRLSPLAIDLGFTAALVLRLGTAGAAAFLPVLLATTLAREALGGLIVPAKIVLFAGGMVVFRGLIRRMNVFTREERETLYSIFESRGIRFVRGVL